ncbi:helix-turn-helix domain-containing protein [Halorubrum halodurans]|uniref:Bacterio-opsin activator n=1 Tax=Halorubrum halodurans TaxID=1383851 RepID=A0A256IS18_9EURY|nr:helix-turn-helix domain-containing protein [Halorubrum halodurans]OYR59315.1 bacterio-opsin activator [Halorubrum halodurans]
MTDGIHVQLAVSACDACPVATLSAATTVEDVRVDPVDDTVEFVAPEPPDDPPSALEFVEFGGRAHGRYEIARGESDRDDAARDEAAHDEADRDDVGRNGDGRTRPATDGGLAVGGSTGSTGLRAGDAAVPPAADGAENDGIDDGSSGDGVCAGCSCGGLSAAFADFPVSPRETRMDDGELLVSFVLSGHEELEAVVDGFEDAGLDVELRRLLVDRCPDDGRCDVVPVDLTGVTDRQAEVAAVAAERGYFESDGASAADLADELGIAKSTVSEHLRLVTASLFSQVFAEGRDT